MSSSYSFMFAGKSQEYLEGLLGEVQEEVLESRGAQTLSWSVEGKNESLKLPDGMDLLDFGQAILTKLQSMDPAKWGRSFSVSHYKRGQ